MLRFLLDTNAISETAKPSPNPAFLAWMSEVGEPAEIEGRLFLSIFTLGELHRGVIRASPHVQPKLLGYTSAIENRFRTRTLSFDDDAVFEWAEIAERHRRLGVTVGVVDEMIAAIAASHGLTLVTRNVRHFEHAGCSVLSPWSD